MITYMYVVMNKEENRVLVGDRMLSGELINSYVRTVSPLLFTSKVKAVLKCLFRDLKVIKVNIFDLGLDEDLISIRNYDYEWLRLKGSDKFVKVWFKGAIPSNSSRALNGKIIIKGVGNFDINDFELLEF